MQQHRSFYQLRKVFPDCFLKDGKRKIDYVLAYEYHGNTSSPSSSNELDDSKPSKRNLARQMQFFEDNLRKDGLVLEYEGVDQSQDGKTCFIKIHAPFNVLGRQAEIMQIRMPIQEYDLDDGFWRRSVEGIMKKVSPFEIDAKYSVEEPLYFTAPFSLARAEQFLMTDVDTFFTNSQRSRMVYDILIRTPGDPDRPHTPIGLERLVAMGAYVAAYPMHEPLNTEQPACSLASFSPTKRKLQRASAAGATAHDEELTRFNGTAAMGDEAGKSARPPPEQFAKASDRQVLYLTWARWTQFYKKQPLDMIRRYFGEKIGLYFAWLGYYTNCLWPPAIMGFLCILYGLATITTDPATGAICNSMSNTTMCPLCDVAGCKFWKLGDGCAYAVITHVFDNTGTVLFALVMSIWATVFMEGWLRYRYELAFKWDLKDTYLEGRVRPEFDARVATRQRNPITGDDEPFLPMMRRQLRVLASFAGFLFFVLLFCAFIFGIIVYRVIVLTMLVKTEPPIRAYSTLITSISAACINLIVIMILDKFYQWLSYKLTEFELPRTEKEFETSYIWKVFLFQFLNYYSALFYIAFFKGKFAALPGEDKAQAKYKLFGKYNWESCDVAGCMPELLIQLAIIMVGKQLMNNAMEICFPILLNKYREWSTREQNRDKVDNPYTQWERDFNLTAVDDNPLQYEYLEMVIQYGFVTLFVAAFPLAPLFALINNLIEIRLDAYKFVVALRRPVPVRAIDLGVWRQILDFIGRFAVLTNAFVVAFTSEFVPKTVFWIGYGASLAYHDYIDFSLSYYNTSSIKVPGLDIRTDICRFRDWRKPPCDLPKVQQFDEFRDCDNEYGYSLDWWLVLASKLAFVLIFEHLITLLKGMVAWAIPDIPSHILLRMQREEHLTREALKHGAADVVIVKRRKQTNEVAEPELPIASAARPMDATQSSQVPSLSASASASQTMPSGDDDVATVA